MRLGEEREEVRQMTNKENANLDALLSLAEERGFEVEKNKDTGAGPIDLIFRINIHPSLPAINCGFIVPKIRRRWIQRLRRQSIFSKENRGSICTGTEKRLRLKCTWWHQMKRWQSL